MEKNRIITENNNKYRIKEGLINTNLERIRRKKMKKKESVKSMKVGNKKELKH